MLSILSVDLEWKIIYVGAAESEEHDQTLDSVLVGPVPAGKHMFVFQAGPPDTVKIPVQDAVGVTVVLLTCSYRSREFIRVGYYVNNEYSDPELKENPPSSPQYDKVERNILATNPRVTRFKIDWDDTPATDSENVPPTNSTESESNQMKDVSLSSSGKPLAATFSTESNSNMEVN
ncbi:histone chaperone asf1b-B-like [Saccostrea cucullata]|uniref:histone chaperone asf1b-B-like n=1 Tax=Saccostrea cuccullata TaxID=36930 RepID=UPI002ED56B8D